MKDSTSHAENPRYEDFIPTLRIPATISNSDAAGPGLRVHDDGFLSGHALGDEICRRLPERIRHPGQTSVLRRADCGIDRTAGGVPLPDALAHDRRFAADRIPPAWRCLRTPGASGAVVLPGKPNRRPDVPCHQRPEQRAHAVGPGDHVLGEHDPDHDLHDHPDDQHRLETDDRRVDSAPVRLLRGPSVRAPDPPFERGVSEPSGESECAGSGESFRDPCRQGPLFRKSTKRKNSTA